MSDTEKRQEDLNFAGRMLALHRTIPGVKWGDNTAHAGEHDASLIVDWLVDRITDPGEEMRHLRSMCNNEYTPMVRHLLLVTAQRGSTSALYLGLPGSQPTQTQQKNYKWFNKNVVDRLTTAVKKKLHVVQQKPPLSAIPMPESPTLGAVGGVQSTAIYVATGAASDTPTSPKASTASVVSATLVGGVDHGQLAGPPGDDTHDTHSENEDGGARSGAQGLRGAGGAGGFATVQQRDQAWIARLQEEEVEVKQEGVGAYGPFKPRAIGETAGYPIVADGRPISDQEAEHNANMCNVRQGRPVDHGNGNKAPAPVDGAPVDGAGASAAVVGVVGVVGVDGAPVDGAGASAAVVGVVGVVGVDGADASAPVDGAGAPAAVVGAGAKRKKPRVEMHADAAVTVDGASNAKDDAGGSRNKQPRVSFDPAAQDERINQLAGDVQMLQQGQAQMLSLLSQLVPKPPPSA